MLWTKGCFITQQVGWQNCMELNRFLQKEPLSQSAISYFPKKVQQIGETGFQILDQREAFPTLTFLDITGIVFYLKVISWQIKDFSIEKYRDRLYQLYQIIGREGGFEVKQHRYLLEAKKCNDRSFRLLVYYYSKNGIDYSRMKREAKRPNNKRTSPI